MFEGNSMYIRKYVHVTLKQNLENLQTWKTLSRLTSAAHASTQASVNTCHLTMGVNAAGVAGVATPQYLTWRGRPVLTTPPIF